MLTSGQDAQVILSFNELASSQKQRKMHGRKCYQRIKSQEIEIAGANHITQKQGIETTVYPS
ncbi:hypothetical protein M514_19908 [Trichuris suis]|uniref:Uncharacterized protein n=1 Tax=Trichuris suis TaxID=68888 RepID=A0A085NEC9_9BILA|nr:hypothetical protein M514_19908 [Trichuris suis]